MTHDEANDILRFGEPNLDLYEYLINEQIRIANEERRQPTAWERFSWRLHD